MNVSGRISRHVNTLVHSYHFCVRRSHKIIFTSEGLSPFFLYCDLIPRMTHCQSITVKLSTQGNLFERFFLLSLLWKAPGNKTLLLISAFEDHLFSLSFVSYLTQTSVLITKASGDHSGLSEFLNHMKYVDRGWMTVSFPPHCLISLTLQFSIWAEQT